MQRAAVARIIDTARANVGSNDIDHLWWMPWVIKKILKVSE